MAKPADPKPWQRERPGRYRSGDGRFAIEQGDPGRWFLVDEAAHDELGLPRTLGPFATLDDAKHEADGVRSAPPAPSPLAGKLAARKAEAREPDRATTDRPGGSSRGAAVTPFPKGRDAARDGEPDEANGSGESGVSAEAEESAEPAESGRRGGRRSKSSEPVRLPAPSWLDRLDRPEAARARRLILALRKLGLEDADEIVRRDFQTAEPAIADALLERFVRTRVVARWQDELSAAERRHAAVGDALAAAREAGVSADTLDRLTGALADAVAADTLSVISEFDRDPSTDGVLPGWSLLERRTDDARAPSRRMHVRRDEGTR